MTVPRRLDERDVKLLWLAAGGQLFFGYLYLLALRWHRPATVGPLRAMIICTGLVAVTYGLTWRALARRRADLAALVVTAQMLMLIGFLLRMRLGALPLTAVGLYLVAVGAAVGGFVLGRGLERNPRGGRERRRMMTALAVIPLVGALALRFAAWPTTDGARVSVPLVRGLTFQPAELVRVCLIGLTALLLDPHAPVLQAAGEPVREARRRLVAYAGLPTLFGLALFVSCSDLGPAVLLVCGVLAVVIVVTRKWRYLAITIATFGPITYATTRLAHIRKVSERFAIWWHPFCATKPMTDPSGKLRHGCVTDISQQGYSLLADVRGGLVGSGPGLGRPETIGAERVNDYILAVVNEELGLAGFITVAIIYAVLVTLLFRLVTKGPESGSRTWAIGLAVMLTVNIALPMFGVTRGLPVIGVTTPLLSAGGTSIIVTMAVIGLIAGIGAGASGGPMVVAIGGTREVVQGGRLLRVRAAVRRLTEPWLAAAVVLIVALIAYAEAGPAQAWKQEHTFSVALYRNHGPRAEIISSDGTVLAHNGIGRNGSVIREYPEGSLTGAVTGYFYPDGPFVDGVEESAADRLECGRPPGFLLTALVGRHCQPTSVHVSTSVSISERAARALGDQGLPGAVVALNPSTGDVLAAVSTPSASPADGPYDPNCVIDPTVTGCGHASRDEIIHRQRGTSAAENVIGGLAVRAAGPIGDLAGMVRPAAPDLRAAAKGFGFSVGGPSPTTGPCGTQVQQQRRCDVDGMDVAGSYLRDGTLYASPLEMAMVAEAIGEHGSLHRPRLITGYGGTGPRPESPVHSAPNTVTSALSPGLADQLTAQMVTGPAAAAAQPPGCGQVAARAASDRYGAKAQDGAKDRDAANTDVANDADAWMVAFAPAHNPVIAVAVYLQAPAGRPAADLTVAGSIARAVLSASPACRQPRG
jgi:cell division protein FtsW (lipid II flippase)